MIEEMKPDAIEKLLYSRILGHIACHADDLSYVVPVSYAYDGRYIYVRSEEGMKINMMRKNPKVCFQVEKMENMANWESAVLWGEFEELKNTEERNHALQELMDRVLPFISSETVQLSPHWPFLPQDISTIQGVVFRIKVLKKTGRVEKSEEQTFFAS